MTLNPIQSLGFRVLGCGHGIGCSLVWDTPRPLASVRSSQPTRLMGIPAGAKAAPRGSRLRAPTASQPQPVTLRDVRAKTLMEQPASRAQPLSCTSKNSQIERLSDTLPLGVGSKNPPRNRGLPHTCPRFWMLKQPSQIERLPKHCCWEVSRLVKAPGICGDVTAKILTEQKAAADMSKPSQGCQTRCGRCRGSWR